MSSPSYDDLEEALKASSLTAKDLHAIWEQGQPAATLKKKKAAGVSWIEEDLGLARRFTEQALALEEYLLVTDVAREALRFETTADETGRAQLVSVRMLYAQALTRLGQTHAARELLEKCAAKGFQPLGRRRKWELLLQLGDIVREESHMAAADEMRLHTAREALAYYEQALALARDEEVLLPLVMSSAASLIVSAGDPALREPAREKARQILQLTAQREDGDGPRFETTSVKAAALAILDRRDEAAAAFGQLEHFPDATTARLAETRLHAQFLAKAHGLPPDFYKRAFPPLELIVFAGHRPDLPGVRKTHDRFPPEAVERVRADLRKRLAKMKARVGLVGADAGGDLLFTEALLARPKATLHLVLPWSREEFRRINVLAYERKAAPPLWEPLFQQATRQATTVRELGQAYEPASEVGWQYTMEVIAGLALHIARVSRLDVKPMVLWDEVADGRTGGTASFVNFWSSQLGRAAELAVVKMPPHRKSPRPAARGERRCRSERAILHQEVKSMLFADIRGYSRLPERAIPAFVNTFLQRVSQLTACSKSVPLSVNTWGDSVYAVFDFAPDAARFALELTQMIQEGEPVWLEKELFWKEISPLTGRPVEHPLSIRIGLHTGPVFMHHDPVVRRLGFTGAHVNRAARLEPIAEPGEVYASEEFAALCELDSEIRRHDDASAGASPKAGFVCEYAGTMPLAKSYPGRYRIYRVVPHRLFDPDRIAQDVHDCYCAASMARGESAQTNPRLVPWRDLTAEYRSANAAHASDVPAKLRVLGYELTAGHGLAPAEIVIPDALLESLAEREHLRWMEERTRRGWSYGRPLNEAQKRHPLMVAWKKLTEQEREKDREAVRRLPQIIERAGFRVRALARPPEH